MNASKTSRSSSLETTIAPSATRSSKLSLAVEQSQCGLVLIEALGTRIARADGRGGGRIVRRSRCRLGRAGAIGACTRWRGGLGIGEWGMGGRMVLGTGIWG
jgi:hypothetical protein